MNFKTEIKLPNFPFSISHKDKIISVGSCFSENIGEKLKDSKFDIVVNPHGILFNPVSVCKSLKDCLLNKQYSPSELKTNKDLYFSFNHHSSYSGLNKLAVSEKINDSIARANTQLKEAKVLIITLGTSWVYKRIQTNEVVANCYKIPNNQFKKELLTVNEIAESLRNILEAIKLENDHIQVIATISPVRHWKDGVVENQQSKATLHLALKELTDTLTYCHYFPSNEIVLDELRDYRFYAKDMLHPSQLAIDYIWEKFSDSFFSQETKELNQRISQLTKEKNHRPFNAESEEFIAFKKQLDEKEGKLFAEFPYLKDR